MISWMSLSFAKSPKSARTQRPCAVVSRRLQISAWIPFQSKQRRRSDSGSQGAKRAFQPLPQQASGWVKARQISLIQSDEGAPHNFFVRCGFKTGAQCFRLVQKPVQILDLTEQYDMESTEWAVHYRLATAPTLASVRDMINAVTVWIKPTEAKRPHIERAPLPERS